MKDMPTFGSPAAPPTVEGARLTLAEIRRVLDADAVWCPEPSAQAEWVVAADLMSDVLVCPEPRRLLLTNLVTQQTIRTAAIMDYVGVVFVRGKRPPADVLDLAKDRQMAVFVTTLPTFEAAGALYAAMQVRARTGEEAPVDG